MNYSKNFYWRNAVFLFLILFAADCVTAQTTNDNPDTYSDDELYAMDLEKLLTVDVVSASKMNLENESTAAGVVTTVSREQILRSGAKNIEEVLRTVAGFDVIRASFSPNTMVVVRGLHSTEGSNNKILFLIDGHPFRSVFNGDASVFAGNMSLNNLAKIEIIRGPGSTLFGTGAFLGVINLVTREAEKNIEASIAGGSFGTYEFSATGSMASRNKKVKTTVSANHFSTEGPDIMIHSDISKEQLDPFGQAVGHTSTSSAAPGRLSYARKTTQLNLNSDIGKFYVRSFLAGSDDRPPVGPYDALTHGSEYKNTAAFAEFGVKLPVADKKGELLVRTYYDYAKLDHRQTLWSAEATQLFNVFTEITYPQFGDMLTGPALYYDAGEEMIYHTKAEFRGIGSEATFAYNLNNNLKLIGGTMYETNQQFGIKTFANGNIFFEYDAAHLMYLGDRNFLSLEAFGEELEITSAYNWNRKAERNIFAAFAQAEIDLVRSLSLQSISNLLLTVGGRYDHYSDAGDRFNPRAALIFSPVDKLYFKALYGTAFRAPSFSELYTTNNSLTSGDPGLKPEIVTTYELVAGYKPGKNTEASLTYFDTQVRNNIQLGATTSTGFARKYSNTGRLASTGLEASFRYSPIEKLSTVLNMTYQHVEDITRDTISAVLESSGETVSYRQGDFHPGGVPEYILNLGLDYAFTRNVRLAISGNYVGERIRTDEKSFELVPGSFESTGNIVEIDRRKNIPSRLLMNCSLQFQNIVFRGLDFQLSVYNLTDSKVYNEAGGIRAADLRREGVNWMAKMFYKL